MALNEERIKGREEGLKEGLKEGLEKGIEQGEKNKAISMAKNMKARDMDLNLISELTGLSIKEIEEL